MVSGLAAYLLSADLYRQYLQVEGEVAQRVKQLIQELAYRRIPTGFLVLYNGMPYIPP
jgi:acid phosphatase family membrane protein YuiD